MSKSKFRLISILLLFVVGLLAASTVAHALPLSMSVKIDGDLMDPSDTNLLDVERGSDLQVKVYLLSDVSLSNVDVEGFISGYEYNDRERMSDTTHVFDMSPNVNYIKTLNLKIPTRVDEDTYQLRILATDRAGELVYHDYLLKIDVARHLIQIKDVLFYPESAIKAGRALLATVRVKNAGERTEEGVKVTVSIPELGVSAADYIDTLDSGESATSEELYLRVPDCQKAGTYEVRVEVSYDENYEKVTATDYVTVVEEETCKLPSTPGETPKTIITFGPDTQDVISGASGVVYPITITNTASDAKTYVLSVDGVSDWATTRLTPSNVLFVQGQETKAAYLYVAANQNAAAGQHMFVVSVKDSAGNVLKELGLKANVAAGTQAGTSLLSWDRLKRGLEIALILLVVLLVILGLILAFRKLRGSEDEEAEGEAGQTYY